ncbi:AMP-binding protein [Leptospira perolatii]|uniref:AMP-binding protein n=1 Tax=Leptospira perolatii TaxID=2023191 RepID=UPI0013FDC5AA|nr:AMP-binding protein [Leptospira perolatii]
MNTLVDRFHNFAEAYPDRIAVVAPNQSLTYDQLRKSVDQLADRLESFSIGSGSIIAIYLPRVAEIIVSMLAAGKLGAAYTILEDEDHAGGSKEKVLEVSAKIVLTTGEHTEFFLQRGQNTLDIFEVLGNTSNTFSLALTDSSARTRTKDGLVLEGKISEIAKAIGIPGTSADSSKEENLVSDDAAYILFTSGSTGKSKGVIVTYSNIEHYVVSLLERLKIDDPLSYAHVSSLSADLGNTCLFPPLWTGGTIHLVDNSVRRDPTLLLSYIESNQIDVLKITPSHWKAVFATKKNRNFANPLLKYLIFGGELLSRDLALSVIDSEIAYTLVNHYGPTETTIGVAANVFFESASTGLLGSESVALGKPLGSTKFLVRTTDGEFKDHSAVGELFIGGPSVAEGYLKNPEQSAERFLTDIEGETRFYRSGDMVRVDENGALEFLGRVDRQVKVNGYRIELEFIENAALKLEEVIAAVAMMLPGDSNSSLSLAIQTKDTISTAELRARLANHLPKYALPGRIISSPNALPTNSNGKIDTIAIRELFTSEIDEEGDLSIDSSEAKTDQDLISEISRIWKQCLGRGGFHADSDFFQDLGASSLDAIQVISELQARGHKISTNDFLSNPTVHGLILKLKTADRDELQQIPSQRLLKSNILSPSQKWFFGQKFSDPNRWNQSLLLEINSKAQSQRLIATLERVMELHPLLQTSFDELDGQVVAEFVPTRFECFSESYLPENRTESTFEDHILSISEDLQNQIDIVSGKVFKAHIFRDPVEGDKLLLIAHHLSIDVVSWRILLADITRIYGLLGIGQDIIFTGNSPTFWDYYSKTKSRPDKTNEISNDTLVSEFNSENLEKNTHTIWVRFTREETGKIIQTIAQRFGAKFHNALLGLFVHKHLSHESLNKILIDVEGHGRDGQGYSVDSSRIVGWFTEVSQICISIEREGFDITIRQTEKELEDAPILTKDIDSNCDPAVAKLCYNFLGRSAFASNGILNLTPSNRQISVTRGSENNRVYDLKLTARIVEEQLIADLAFYPSTDSNEKMLRSMRDWTETILDLASISSEVDSKIFLEKSSKSGQLTYIPAHYDLANSLPLRRQYSSLLMTGTSGYVGIYLLYLFLKETVSTIYCLIRDSSQESAFQRLSSIFSWYFPEENLNQYSDRVRMIPGNVSQVNYGLTSEDYFELTNRIEAIYDLAADTRLFGIGEVFEKANLIPAKNAISLASTGRPKDLHYVSTLAICGIHNDEKSFRFSEADLDFGQEFQNEYERSKFLAESLVNEFIVSGGTGFIYRLGNVSGHSQTGKFRKDPRQNRLVQTLRAMVKVGKYPKDLSESFVLSSVDEVAKGIFELGLSTSVQSGTYHIDGEQPIAYQEIVNQLLALGVRLEPSEKETLWELLAEHSTGDRDISLGHFWAARKARNVEYDHSRSSRILKQLGVTIRPWDSGALGRFLQGLISLGEFEFGSDKEHSSR